MTCQTKFTKKTLWHAMALPVVSSLAFSMTAAYAGSQDYQSGEQQGRAMKQEKMEHHNMDQTSPNQASPKQAPPNSNEQRQSHNKQAGSEQQNMNAQSNRQAREETSRPYDTQSRAPGFNQVDSDDDQQLVWTEIYAIYDDEINNAGWSEQDVYQQYDADNNNSLGESEYTIFVSGLAQMQDSDFAKGSERNSQQESEARQQAAAQASQHGEKQGQKDRAMEPSERPSQQQAKREGEAQNDATAQDQAEREPNVSIVSVTTVTSVPADLIEDMDVINLQGENIGEVEEVLTEPGGQISGLVVGVGGFWDIGDKDVRVDVSDLTVSGDYIVWDTMLSEDQLEELPEYQS